MQKERELDQKYATDFPAATRPNSALLVPLLSPPLSTVLKASD